MEIQCNQLPREIDNKGILYKNKHQIVLSASIILVLSIEQKTENRPFKHISTNSPIDLNKLLKEL